VIRGWTTSQRLVAHLVVLALVVLCLAPSAVANIAETPPATTTLSATMAGQLGVTFTFAGYQEVSARQVVDVQVTFPAGTNVSAATVPASVGTRTVTGQTVSITFATPFAQFAPVIFSIDNITNRASAGTFSDIGLTFHTTNKGGRQDQYQTFTAGSYTITPAPYITLTIATPDIGQSVDFGAIDPGTTTTPKQVMISVTSSAAYTLTRTITGDVTPLGLLATGAASRAGSAGSASYSDEFTLAPPWTTDPDVPLVATVTYTAIQ